MIGSQGLLNEHFNIIIPPLYDLISKGEKFILVYEKSNAVSGYDYESDEAEAAECYYTLDGENGAFLIIKEAPLSLFNTTLFVINRTECIIIRAKQEGEVWCVKDGLFGLINSKNEIHYKAFL